MECFIQRLLWKMMQLRSLVIYWLDGHIQRITVDALVFEWKRVTSAVPQGCVWEPILFIVLISDIDSGISCTCSKYTNYIQLNAAVTTQESRDVFQRDLDRLQRWNYMKIS